jgi:hypothetical protein
LSSGQVSLLDDTIRSWPENKYVLAGAGLPDGHRRQERDIGGPAPSLALRYKGLQRDGLPQLAEACRLVGEEKAAETISIASLRDLRKRGDLRRRSRLWNSFLDWTVGYGLPARSGPVRRLNYQSHRLSLGRR